MPATVPDAPKLSRVIGLPHALKALWAAPKFNGGAPITSYKLTANCAGSVHTARFGGSARHGTIGGLKAGVACSVTVKAMNRVGSSLPSSALTTHPRA
jgi:hypothetical protein